MLNVSASTSTNTGIAPSINIEQLDDAAAAQTVPACPEWTVKDVVSHICGLNAEKLADIYELKGGAREQGDSPGCSETTHSASPSFCDADSCAGVVPAFLDFS